MMSSHVLRSFLYLDRQAVNDYLASLGMHEEETDVRATVTKSSGISAEAGYSTLKAGGNRGKEEITETTKKIVPSDAANFQKLYAHLESQDFIKYYSALDDDTWGELSRNSIIEADVDLALSKVRQLLDTANQLLPIVALVQQTTGQELIDGKAQAAIAGFNLISQAESKLGIPLTMSLVETPKYKLVTYLNPNNLRVDEQRLTGHASITCKVQRKLKKGESFDLFNPLSVVENMNLNRHDRRAAKHRKQSDLPDMIRGTVKGPALIVTAVAIYH